MRAFETWIKPFGAIGLVIATAFITASFTEQGQREQLGFERSQAFSEFMAARGLPMPGSVIPQCEKLLEACIAERQRTI